MGEKYYSQLKQDKFLNEVIFNKKKGGFFLDIGAHDGVTLSNTYFFEKFKDWEGICIEPNPAVYAKLISNRNCKTLNVCIGNKTNKVKFTQIKGYAEMLSGITANYDERHLRRINESIEKMGGEKTEIDIDMIGISDLRELDEILIDFISIDTEGNEFDIIASIDFNKLKIISLVVENNYGDNRINNYLINCGFDSLENDDVFIFKDYVNIFVNFRLLLWKIDIFSNNILKYVVNKIKR
jgi:FkbM family methyltransferase